MSDRESDIKEMIDPLNELWNEEMGNCCILPCTDYVCREDMKNEGGCKGADLADKIINVYDKLGE